VKDVLVQNWQYQIIFTQGYYEV